METKFNIGDTVYYIKTNYNYKPCKTCGDGHIITLKRVVAKAVILSISALINKTGTQYHYNLETGGGIGEDFLYKTRKEATKALRESEEK